MGRQSVPITSRSVTPGRMRNVATPGFHVATPGFHSDQRTLLDLPSLLPDQPSLDTSVAPPCLHLTPRSRSPG